MLIVISPAKTLDYESPLPSRKFTQPAFLDDAQEVVTALRKLNPEHISALMNVSSRIAELNFSRYLDWEPPFSLKTARQAVFAFKGDVYTGLAAENFDKDDLEFAQQHLRILSGLYGVLRPLDLMQPYRLEMGTRLAFDSSRGKAENLYDFWGERPTQALNKALRAQQDKVLINLASNEYFKVIDRKLLDAEIITPVFRDYKNGSYKVISFFAKKARGQMAAWIIRKRVQKPADLKKFREDGYQYDAALSRGSELVFLRRQA